MYIILFYYSLYKPDRVLCGTNIFKTSCVQIIVHPSVTFSYYYNLSVPYHSQFMFHTLYSFTSLKITFLWSERSLMLQGYCCHTSQNFLLSKKQPLQDSLSVSVTSRITLSPTLNSFISKHNSKILTFQSRSLLEDELL